MVSGYEGRTVNGHENEPRVQWIETDQKKSLPANVASCRKIKKNYFGRDIVTLTCPPLLFRYRGFHLLLGQELPELLLGDDELPLLEADLTLPSSSSGRIRGISTPGMVLTFSLL